MSVSDKIPSYRALEHPLAQLRAAEEFAQEVQSLADEQDESEDGPAPDFEEANAENVLDALASLDMRFEYDADWSNDEGYFSFKSDGGSFDTLLHGWAEEFLGALQEAGMHDLVFEQLCECLGWEGLLVIPDELGLAAKAYRMLRP
jgi:hypothetical protein